MESDELLWERLRGGDRSAFERLYLRYERRLYAFVRSFLDDAAESEDVLHEVFMTLADGRAPAALHLRAWLFQVARNASLNRLRARRRGEAARERQAAEPAPRSPLPSEALEHVEAERALARAVTRLPAHLKQLYLLRAAGLSYEELAQSLEIPLGTVKSRLHELVATLKKELQPWTANG